MKNWNHTIKYRWHVNVVPMNIQDSTSCTTGTLQNKAIELYCIYTPAADRVGRCWRPSGSRLRLGHPSSLTTSALTGISRGENCSVPGPRVLLQWTRLGRLGAVRRMLRTWQSEPMMLRQGINSLLCSASKTAEYPLTVSFSEMLKSHSNCMQMHQYKEASPVFMEVRLRRWWDNY